MEGAERRKLGQRVQGKRQEEEGQKSARVRAAIPKKKRNSKETTKKEAKGLERWLSG